MIQSERSIRRMSETHGLIAPFVDKQVRRHCLGRRGLGVYMRQSNTLPTRYPL